MWDTAQALCSSVLGVLATRAVLKGVGVGNEAATPLAGNFSLFQSQATLNVDIKVSL